jgi:hypothetical protein
MKRSLAAACALATQQGGCPRMRILEWSAWEAAIGLATALCVQVCGASGVLCGKAADKAMTIAADVCIYTNHNFTVEALKSEVAPEQPSKLLAGH